LRCWINRAIAHPCSANLSFRNGVDRGRRKPALIYFDHNATHPLLASAREAWLDATERFIGNPSSPHRLGERADRALSEAREQLAEWIGCSPHELVWTSGATESNNAAIAHLAAMHTGTAFVSSIEHPCVLAATKRYFAGRYELIPVTAEGVIDLAWLRDAVNRTETACVVVMAANNETGIIQPFWDVLLLCRERNIPMLCDAAQQVGRMVEKPLGEIPFVSGCAHKFGGPPGVGFLKCPYAIRPLLLGGPQEEGRRAGTENVPGVLSMIAALRTCLDRLEAKDFTETALTNQRRFETSLLVAVPGVRILGQCTFRLWNTSAVIMPPARDCRQRWVVKMDRLGFAVSTGSACASGKEESSHVLRAMGVPADEAGRALRFSAGIETTWEQWQSLVGGLRQAAEELL
jgi:cysteine desulfurase